jgi:hypothetical protein
MEVSSLPCNRTIVRIRSARARLILRFHRDGTVESTVRIAGIGLRLRSNADAVPSCEEVV